MKLFILISLLSNYFIPVFGQMEKTGTSNPAANQLIKVLELRNYVTKPGMRNRFLEYFETNFIDSQNKMGAYVLGQYTVKGYPDNFFWVRGFNDMAARSKFLPAFYQGAFWKSHRNNANAMLVNNDNVYLLKPLGFSGSDTAINSNELGRERGLVVIDYYIANTRLPELINFFKNKYLSFLQANGAGKITLWISEVQENDFPALPVFQDKNLLVAITLYSGEKEYDLLLKQLQKAPHRGMQLEMKEIVTSQHTVLLYPSKNSFMAGD